jgi:hypothetical protein
MTWGEFKAALEQAGVLDQYEIQYIDIGSLDDAPIVKFDRTDDDLVYFNVEGL